MKKTIVMLTAAAVLVAACGETADGEPSEPAPSTTSAPATTAVPTTVAPKVTTTLADAGGIVPGADPDIDAIAAAYTIAFDSTSSFAAKAPYIEDPNGLEDTVAKYLTTGETMGGISVLVTEVTVDGTGADVVYDLLFNNNPTYPDLPGTAVLTADGWKVPRTIFCSLMSSARVGCPTA